ncbi:MAG: cellulase family glycosylhydrolase [Chloroflexi bacterium]|nr:cellulase family glycosylhydrolase [Chloroflexota bacterium]
MPTKSSAAPHERDFARKQRDSILIILGLLVVFALIFLLRPAPRDWLPAEKKVVETTKGHVCVHTLLENEVEEKKILRSLELVRELGATSIVQFFPWAYAETRAGQFSWSRFDRIVQHADRQGLEVIARLGLVPDWLNDDESKTLNYLPDSAFSKFAEYAAAFAARYVGLVDRLIIWNEPNLSFEWGYQKVDAARYVRLLQAAYPAIKATNPEAVVLAGALAPTLEGRGSNAGLNDLDFLRDMYAAGASDSFDALAIHSYGMLEPPEAQPASDKLNFRRAELLREIMLEHGDGEKPVSITESGWNDHPRWAHAVRPSQRSAYTIRAFEYAEMNWEWAEQLCIWAFRFPADLQSYPDSYTLVSADFVKKPIYFALQDYALGWERSEDLWLPPPETER